MKFKKIAIGNDHAGLELKRALLPYLEEKGLEIEDVGTQSPESFPYAVSGYRVAKLVADGTVDAGLLICGTGVGISLAANKVKGIRACVCSDTATARLTRQHNNSNILSLGARIVGLELAKDIVDAWLDAEFEGGRHQIRIDMIKEIEETGSLKALEVY